MSDDKIYIATVSAPTNIACIKYWGKADVKWNTPTNDSISVTMDQTDLRAVTTVATSTKFVDGDKLWLNGIEESNAATNKRFRACVDGIKALASDPNKWTDMKYVHVSSYNTFPTAAGLASSAAGYAALVAALIELFDAKEQYPGQFTTIARQGSGSACRSLYGGFVAWRMGNKESSPTGDTTTPWSNSIAEQIADEKHWPELRAMIMVVSDLKKDTSSTSGMTTSLETSLLLQHRISSDIVPKRMEQIINAFQKKDFTTFGQITMQDSNQFHSVCLDTYPPIFYMNDTSKSIVRIIHAYNKYYDTDNKGTVRAAYTFDAGPNAVIYTLEEYTIELGAILLHYYPTSDAVNDYVFNNPTLIEQISNYKLNPELIKALDKTGRTPTSDNVKKIYVTKCGCGPKVLNSTEVGTLDPETGENTYQPK